MFNHFKYLIEEYLEEIRTNSKSPEGYLNKGKTHIYMGEYERAVKDFENASEIAPNSHEVWYQLGVAYLKMEKYKKAESAFSKAEKIHPKDFNTLYNLAFCSTQLEYHKVAIDQWRKVLSYQKDMWEAYFYRGKMYFMGKKYPEAIRDFLDAIAFLPSTAISNVTKCDFLLAKAYLESADNEKAIEYATKVIEAMPTHIEAFLVRAAARKNLGDWVGYEADSKVAGKEKKPYLSNLSANLTVLNSNKTQNSNKKNARAKEFLAKAQNALNEANFDAAIEFLGKLILEDSMYSQAYFLRGIAYFQLMNMGKAENDFNTAISLNKTHWQYYAERAKLYDFIGKAEYAKKDKKKAADLKHNG